MSTSIAQNIEALCQEQGIDRDLVIEAIKEAVRAAAKKQFKGGEDIQVDWSSDTGLEISASKVVVDEVADPFTELSIDEARELGGEEVEIGDALLLPLPMEELGRIAAQTAKQILFQKVRDAVRNNVYEQYIDRVGELVNGFVKRFERGNMIVDLGNLEAILPRSQQSRGEAIIRELRGEKIDIIEWSEEPSVFAANSLSPAKVNQVRITDIENRQMEVIVNEDQLSLAIGKRGQNVRLATKLVGWNIDIRSEEEIKREVHEQMSAMIASGEPVPLSATQVVTAQQAEALVDHGVADIDALAHTTVDDLVEFLDVSLDEAETILKEARSVVQSRDQSLAASEDEVPATEIVEEQHAVSAEFDEEAAGEVEPNDKMTAPGYDEAVEQGTPFSAEANHRAHESAEPVALTEADPFSVDELVLQQAGRDLRPDVVTPAPDITSTAVADLEAASEAETATVSEAEADTIETEIPLESSPKEVAATNESLKDEKQ